MFTVMPQISIIIPVYNAEQYLTECLDSILGQSFSDYEVIMVDDGSTDGSADVCLRYAEADPRFVYIYKENGGVSSARNKGLDMARGEWVSFIDADDWVSEDYLSSFMQLEHKADVTFFGETSVEMDGTISQKIPEERYCEGRSDVEETIYYLKCGSLGDVLGWTWDKFLRNSIIKEYDIRFVEEVSFREDELFALEYCRYIHSICTIGKSLYFYRVIETGLTKRGIRKNDLMPSSLHLLDDYACFSHEGLKEHILQSATDYRAMNIYKQPLSQLPFLLKDYIEMVKTYPQPGLECKINHLTSYLRIGYMAGFIYCLLRKL